MKVKSIAEYSPWSILQYFWPVLSNYQSWKPIFGLLLSGHLRQVFSYTKVIIFLLSQVSVSKIICYHHK